MSSAYGSLPRPRYSRARRAAIVAACASVLTGTAMALPAATFAEENPDPAPIVSLDLAGTNVAVPDVGVPLPNVELSTEQLPVVAPVTGALGLTAVIDTVPQPADTAPGTTEPGTTEPGTTEPGGTAPGGTAPGAPEPEATTPSQDEPVQTDAQKPALDLPADEGSTTLSSDVKSDLPSDADRASSGRSTPATAVADAPTPGSRLVTAAPTADQAAVKGVLEIRSQKQIERAAAVRAAQVLGTEKSTPEVLTKKGLGLVAPLTDLGSRKVDTLNLASRNGPASATGDWNLLPEALYAVIPLLLAGAAVLAHNRRNTRIAAASVGVVQRRRHALK